MLACPQDLVQRWLASFAQASLWTTQDAGLFEHPQGLRVQVEDAPRRQRHVFLVYDHWALDLDAPFDLPGVKPHAKKVCLGSLQFSDSSFSLEAFQQALHTQWGLDAQQRLKALSHVLAERLDAEGGSWYSADGQDSFYNAQRHVFPSPWSVVLVQRVMQAHHLCRLNDRGVYERVPFLPLQHLGSHHERLQMAPYIDWALKVLDISHA